MQKIILTSLLVFFIGGQIASAEVSPATPEIKDASVDGDNSNVQQDEFIKIMEDNLYFEKQKRQLVNEVALEKLRSELKKLRGTATSPVMPAMTETSAPREVVSKPNVILVSKIGGLTKVLVSEGGSKHYLSRGERFSSGGKNYILIMDSAGRYQVKEHQQ
ncbi:hypothetical protein [Salmonella bongori]|uniref:LngG n=2 Tax=Salmonella TaxID=590 RepID=A0A750P4H5_SALER|nr:hypothetical protein [Salmonella bongori]AID26928.1 hypothetical protein N643_01370 [Salmonella bongori serovar 48:z41:-- str. RKS3044]EGS1130234.1 hypothetical protein [Salmonella bongori CFSAN000509]MBA2134747.1 hypothetical protein [Salmonella bongori serovar 66:z39:-]HAC6696219.1 hypothetical protein [Salmonella bongori serovar 44:r:-]